MQRWRYVLYSVSPARLNTEVGPGVLKAAPEIVTPRSNDGVDDRKVETTTRPDFWRSMLTLG
jgi:hypothetical protein